MPTDLDEIEKELRAARKVGAALVLTLRTDKVEADARAKELGGKLDANTAELRRLTDATKALSAQVAPIAAAGEARDRVLGKVFNRITRLTILEGVAMILVAFSLAVLLAGPIVAITEPQKVLTVMLQVVSTVTGSEPPPSTLPEDR